MTKLYAWKPVTPEDHLLVYRIGPTSCMSLIERHGYKDDAEMELLNVDDRWDMYTFQHKGLHPGLFYYDNPHVSLLCVANDKVKPTKILGRANIWDIDGQKYYSSLYGQYCVALVEYCKSEGMKALPEFGELNMPTYMVVGRRIIFHDRAHYILPWAFCDDFSDFNTYPRIEVDKDSASGGYTFLVNTNTSMRGKTISNAYPFNGFISHLDIITDWRIPQQNYRDARQRNWR